MTPNISGTELNKFLPNKEKPDTTKTAAICIPFKSIFLIFIIMIENSVTMELLTRAAPMFASFI